MLLLSASNNSLASYTAIAIVSDDIGIGRLTAGGQALTYTVSGGTLAERKHHGTN